MMTLPQRFDPLGLRHLKTITLEKEQELDNAADGNIEYYDGPIGIGSVVQVVMMDNTGERKLLGRCGVVVSAGVWYDNGGSALDPVAYVQFYDRRGAKSVCEPFWVKDELRIVATNLEEAINYQLPEVAGARGDALVLLANTEPEDGNEADEAAEVLVKKYLAACEHLRRAYNRARTELGRTETLKAAEKRAWDVLVDKHLAANE